jgi:hypothetical protein
MPLVLADRVQENTSTTGTGTITLAGAVSGFNSFSVIGDGNTTYYTIVGGTQWEVGLGTYTSSGTTLSRDTVLSSSNSNALVDFSAGVKTVFVTYPAGKSVYANASGNVGIGTSSPETVFKLSVIGNAFVQNPSGNTVGKVVVDNVDNRLVLGSYYEAGVGQYSFISSTNNAETGNVDLVFRTGTTERMRIDSNGMVLPAANNTYDLGSTSLRWRNIYTNDLHLSNGIGDYTVVEGEEDLFLYNNKTGKVFKFLLTEVKPEDAPPKARRD